MAWRKNMVKMLLLSLLLPMVLLCQTQNPMMDNDGVANGRFWRAMPNGEKVVYLQGLFHGMQLAGVAVEVKYPDAYATILAMTPSGFSFNDYQREMDTLYQDTENLLINFRWAWTYCSMKLKGTSTKKELETELIRLRQIASKNATPK
jgi:hypothetical protein